MEPDVIAMSAKELQRLPVLEAVLKRQTTQREAATCLELSTRQVRRLQGRLEGEGPKGLAHRSRGRGSNRAKPARLRVQALALIRQKYADFGPTLASEKLAQEHRVRVNDETLRRWMRAEGLLAGRRRPRPHRQWRERSACRGAMVQMDGSHHDWLEGRGPRLVLMGYVDDATGRIYGRFYDSEDLPAALDSFKRYAQLYGLPQSVYLDKHTIYRSPGPRRTENRQAVPVLQSQFERALSQLGVRVIHANSPQAKGRVERLFKTLQDRLVKELRLAGARSLAEANQQLSGFLTAYNQRFARPARQPGNLHRVVSSRLLNQALCVQEPRRVANDGTIQVRSQRLQLMPSGLRPLAQKRVTVLWGPKDRLRVLRAGRPLPYRVLPPPPQRPSEQTPGPGRGGYRPSDWRPGRNHPWRKNYAPATMTTTQTLKSLKLQTFKAKQTLKPDISNVVETGHF